MQKLDSTVDFPEDLRAEAISVSEQANEVLDKYEQEFQKLLNEIDAAEEGKETAPAAVKAALDKVRLLFAALCCCRPVCIQSLAGRCSGTMLLIWTS